jgi:hypothetical protein
MKYSLRSLMIVVTLICVLLGVVAGRIEYFRRWAVFHEKEVARGVQDGKQILADGKSQFLHKWLARDYRRAMTRPWTVVDESRAEPIILTKPVFVTDVMPPEEKYIPMVTLPNSSAPAPNQPKN